MLWRNTKKKNYVYLYECALSIHRSHAFRCFLPIHGLARIVWRLKRVVVVVIIDDDVPTKLESPGHGLPTFPMFSFGTPLFAHLRGNGIFLYVLMMMAIAIVVSSLQLISSIVLLTEFHFVTDSWWPHKTSSTHNDPQYVFTMSVLLHFRIENHVLYGIKLWP